MKFCPNCGIKLVSDGKFCSECGAKLAMRGNFCFECGAKLLGSGNFCSECGTKMYSIEEFSPQKQEIKEPKITISEEVEHKDEIPLQIQTGSTPKTLNNQKVKPKIVRVPMATLDNSLEKQNIENENNIDLMLKALEQNDPNLAKEYYKKAIEIDKENAEIEISKNQQKIAEYFKQFAIAELDFFKAMLEEWKRPKYPYLPDAEWKSKMQISYTKAKTAVDDWIIFDSKNAEAYFTAGVIEKIYCEMRTDYYSNSRKIWFTIDKRARAFFDKALEIDPNFEEAKKLKKEKKKSYCFIATAAYKTPFAHEIDILRDFRDTTLEKKRSGRIFINLYYKTSPPIAIFIAKSEKRRLFVRKLLNPLVNLLKRKNFNYE